MLLFGLNKLEKKSDSDKINLFIVIDIQNKLDINYLGEHNG